MKGKFLRTNHRWQDSKNIRKLRKKIQISSTYLLQAVFKLNQFPLVFTFSTINSLQLWLQLCLQWCYHVLVHSFVFINPFCFNSSSILQAGQAIYNMIVFMVTYFGKVTFYWSPNWLLNILPNVLIILGNLVFTYLTYQNCTFQYVSCSNVPLIGR